MTVQDERRFWDAAAADPNVEENWICDPAFGPSDCLEAVLKDVKDQESLRTIVELGSGIGRLAIPMADRFPNAIVIGIDISQLMTELARQRGRTRENLVFAIGTGRTISMETADFIYSVFMFQHLPPDAIAMYLEDIARYLQGQFRFQFVEGDTPHSPFHYQYSEAQMEQMVLDAGLKLENMEQLLHDQWRWVTVSK